MLDQQLYSGHRGMLPVALIGARGAAARCRKDDRRCLRRAGTTQCMDVHPYVPPVCDTDSQRVMPAKHSRNVRETCVMSCATHAKCARNVRVSPRNARETCVTTSAICAKRPRNVREMCAKRAQLAVRHMRNVREMSAKCHGPCYHVRCCGCGAAQSEASLTHPLPHALGTPRAILLPPSESRVVRTRARCSRVSGRERAVKSPA